jgi:acyl-CoA thioesterase
MPSDVNPNSWSLRVEMREAAVRERGETSAAFWCRLRDGEAVTPAAVGFMADFVPLGVAQAAGKMGAGSSLDNSMRFRGGVADTEWVLVDLAGELAHGGFGHGRVRVWAEDGALLAVGTQSASMRYLFEPGEPPNLPPRPPGR